jgi:hypothetical protein
MKFNTLSFEGYSNNSEKGLCDIAFIAKQTQLFAHMQTY